jgi:hypothetical protein|tara:strand:- start:1496 stop:1705 length:210 start_codon:yes stop_codon:yes gene_type:complete
MDPSKENGKRWEKVRIFNNYQDANELRCVMLDNDDTGNLLVKVNRCGPEGSQFKVKKHFTKLTNKGKER